MEARKDLMTNAKNSWAYSFKTKELSLHGLMKRLNSVGSWEWVQGDSAWYGDYLGTRAVPYDAVVRVYLEADHFVLQLHRTSFCSAEAEMIIITLRDSVLPAIGAQEIAPHEGID